jgi:hypothetical protein
MTLVLGTAAGGFLAAGLTSLSTLPVAHADPAAVGAAVTADQFSDLLTAEGTQADNAVDNFYQGIANFFAPEAMGNAVTADQFSDLLTGEGTQADNAVDNFYQGIANFFAPEAAGSAATAGLSAANADDGDGITIANPPGADPDFLSGPLQNFGMFSMQGFADPDEHFDAAVMTVPSLGITDLLTSGIDPSDHLALADPGLGLPADVTAGTVDSTVNTFNDAMAPALDPLLSFSLPFTDPLTDLWVALLPLGA